jgi:hypothetical protein
MEVDVVTPKGKKFGRLKKSGTESSRHPMPIDLGLKDLGAEKASAPSAGEMSVFNDIQTSELLPFFTQMVATAVQS